MTNKEYRKLREELDSHLTDALVIAKGLKKHCEHRADDNLARMKQCDVSDKTQSDTLAALAADNCECHMEADAMESIGRYLVHSINKLAARRPRFQYDE